MFYVVIILLCGAVGFMGLKMAFDYWREGSPGKRIGAVIVGIIGLAFGSAAVFAALAALGIFARR